jgi:rRNA processing protein Krr1/Pno1
MELHVQLFTVAASFNISGCMQIAVPQHRMTPLKKAWLDIYKTVTEVLKFDMRMNLKTRKAGIPAFG